MQKGARSSPKDSFDKMAAYLLKRIEERDVAASSLAAGGGNVTTGSMVATGPSGASDAPKDPSKGAEATESKERAVRRRGEKACWQCGAGGLPLKKCSVCGVAWYCGPDCQKAAWKAHKIECPNLKAAKV